MPIEKMDLINNPETAPFSKLKYLRRLPDEEVAEFFNQLFLLNVAARDTGDWSPVDRYLEERGDQIAAQVAVPMHFDAAPWAPFKKRLSESKIAVMTTGGVYVKGQKPFDTDGDWSFREIPLGYPTGPVTHCPHSLRHQRSGRGRGCRAGHTPPAGNAS